MDIKDYASDYESATQYFTDLVSSLKPNDLDKSAFGEWTPRQVVHHLADAEAQSYARVRRLVAEPPGSIIQGYDEGLWSQNQILGYKQLPIKNSMAVFVAVRAASLEIIQRLSPDDLERYGEHTESGRYTIAKWIKTYTKHPRDHAGQIEKVVAG